VWSVAVVAHIVRAAIEVPLLTGVAVATSYAALAILVARQLALPASG